MNKTNLKRYAPQARKDFIAAVTARAQLLGLNEVGGTPQAEPCTVNGEVAVIAGRPWPASVQGKRERLFQRMKRDGFSATLEAVAYTWFNRFAALRYMELHDYLGHGRRVLSNPEGGLPEALAYALDLAEAGDLPGLRPDAVRQFKLDNQDSELFRRVLVAQCNALHGAMPFLFERIDDDSELLLPDNLLRSDSVIAKLVDEIPEEDWAEVEIIGWLYQFYISEKKDQVIGKVVKSEDIPAATQLFTPNWIVQYLVQNSVGRLWLMANPQSTLAEEWPYYITPAEQTPEVQAQLDALIQTRVREDGDVLNPESITVLDPACGSGHILVVAYDVLKAIYLERGYQPRAIPRLILEKNLYGLDIDDRAAQMAGFALLMKARADDRRLFTATDDAGTLQPPKLNVLSLQESKGLSVDELATHLAPFSVQRATITALVDTFEHAKTFGSLIQIPYALKTHLALLPEVLALVKQSGELYATAAADDLLPLVQQANVLAMQFDAVVANPPYMGIRYYANVLKEYIETNYANEKGDLYTAFMARNTRFLKGLGLVAMLTIPNWMFLSSFQSLRDWLTNSIGIDSLCHNGRGVFGSDFGSCAFVLFKGASSGLIGSFKKLFDKQGSIAVNDELSQRFFSCNPYMRATVDFRKVPGSPIAYWLSEEAISAFAVDVKIGQVAIPRKGMATGDNNKYVRIWSELNIEKIGLGMSRDEAKVSNKKWFPYANGGGFRKWYGMIEDVVLWENDGHVLQNAKHTNGLIRAVGLNLDYIFKEGVTWSPITSAQFSSRLLPVGCLFSSASNTLFPTAIDSRALMGQANSSVFEYFSKIINPTLNLNTGDIANIPIVSNAVLCEEIIPIVDCLVDDHKRDWDSFEGSFYFVGDPLIELAESNGLLGSCWEQVSAKRVAARFRSADNEASINSLLIEHFGFAEELSAKVPEDQITLARADREKDCQRLISYAIGCMMGRYSLDEPGLIYAHAGNVGFEPGRYVTFPADADAIVPFTDELWFADDACSRIREFQLAVWGPDTLEENMAWLAESLGTKASETPDETIRRYLADKFFKDHVQTYKKRPIYWLFSSGKQGAFQALVYLHRYHEGTLARLRAEYVVPLTGKIQSRIEMLQKDALAASSTAARNKLAKEVEKLKKKHVELLAYDEQLRHYADMRITLDLDDGVKVNYGKFGDLLEGVKVVAGGAGDD
ncbi:MAG: BREX-1 system adenine-specific DNA-methyltransferase PglX [Aquabacterium sp.]|uniref:BREX-1 system adenine-specific DNA-methyltransferase PglX n=1 Tax=Aquabacterium sp. TaxID=1872578 RepID=UPI00271C6857|nr:BREX-1 system adenine-specific DNA-methyltransferase PglX [Aquabacterium sp.]MDO9001865.1 BREX-1 system adenine-specific DNA-methyltransferase PglX [Aquabacterium sp.]